MSWFTSLFGEEKPPAPTLAPTETPTDSIAELTHLIHSHSSQLPVPSIILTLSMVSRLERITAHMQNNPRTTMRERNIIELTITDYIPRTINIFLETTQDDSHRESLIKQLLILSDTLDENIRNITEHHNQQLDINQRFLQDKFGR